MERQELFLGIDIGTSKIAVVVINSSKEVISSQCEVHNRNIGKEIKIISEQNPSKIIDVCFELIKKIPYTLKKQLIAIGVTGQMHGIVLLDKKLSPVTNLINWQDQRCSQNPNFLANIKNKTGYKLNNGYGFASLAWLIDQNSIPPNAAFCCTIQDFLVCNLIECANPIIDSSDASSWGLFNFGEGKWDNEALKSCNIPADMLPKIVPCGSFAGLTENKVATNLGIPDQIPVMAAIGDNQASILGSLSDPEKEIAITIGTGCQTSIILPEALIIRKDSKFECRPFMNGKMLVVAAPLCGGSAWEWLAESIIKIIETIGLKAPPIETIYEIMDNEGMRSSDELIVEPNFLGERYDESLKGLIGNIKLNNLSVGSLSKGVARGIVKNMKKMLPEEITKNKIRIVGSGNALRRVKLLQQMVKEEFNLPLLLQDNREEAAIGAAVNALLFHLKQ